MTRVTVVEVGPRDGLQNETVALAKVPAVRQKLIDLGMIPQGSTSQEYAKFIVEETARIRKLIEAGKLTL